jgi:RecA/RadA recombinase
MGKSILSGIVDMGEFVSAIVGELLKQLETSAVRSNPQSSRKQLVNELNHVLDPDVLYKRAESWPRKKPWFEQPRFMDRLSERLIQLVAAAWLEDVRPRGARRPDVLKLTCQALADPDTPHSYFVGRFGVFLALRALYDIRYTNESLMRLKNAYKELEGRFKRTQRRRQIQGANPYESFLLDVLCLESYIQRVHSGENAIAYYVGFSRAPYGVNQEKQRVFAESAERLPQLAGKLPGFSTILNAAFSQPTGVPGMDETTGGLVPVMSGDVQLPGGLVTLIAGPPGSGKTSLSLSIAARMAQFGSIAKYIATEEGVPSLQAKLTAMGEPSFHSLWPFDCLELSKLTEALELIDGSTLTSIEQLGESVTQDLSGDEQEEHYSQSHSDNPHADLFLVFPRIVVIDSLTALLHGRRVSSENEWMTRQGGRDVSAESRRALGNTLDKLRSVGVCVILVGGLEDRDDSGLAYLVDNVFTLGAEADITPRHPLRSFTIEKTRHQTSDRGRHVFHISRNEGVSVSPSLHSVLRFLKGQGASASDPRHRALLWTRIPDPQLELPGFIEAPEAMTIRDKSQVLIYGKGPAAKARFALSIALEPRIPVEPVESYRKYVERHHRGGQGANAIGLEFLERTRILVVSFLYGPQYYMDIAEGIMAMRYHKRSSADINSWLDVLDFYPGFIDAETLIQRIRKRLVTSRLEGRRFTSVIIDGVHNLMLQFPLLQAEPLLWPTMYRLFRTEAVETISTFTFFQRAEIRKVVPRRSFAREIPKEHSPFEAVGVGMFGSEDLFFHLLASSCDYTLVVERPQGVVGAEGRNLVFVHMASSIDAFGREPPSFWWNPDTFRYVKPPPEPLPEVHGS